MELSPFLLGADFRPFHTPLRRTEFFCIILPILYQHGDVTSLSLNIIRPVHCLNIHLNFDPPLLENFRDNAYDIFSPLASHFPELFLPWRRESLSTPVFWPGESHGLYSIVHGLQRVGHDWATFTLHFEMAFTFISVWPPISTYLCESMIINLWSINLNWAFRNA